MYDIANGLTYTTAWSDDGSKYTVQLQCPPPEDADRRWARTTRGAAQLLDGNASLTTTTYNEYMRSAPRPSASA